MFFFLTSLSSSPSWQNEGKAENGGLLTNRRRRGIPFPKLETRSPNGNKAPAQSWQRRPPPKQRPLPAPFFRILLNLRRSRFLRRLLPRLLRVRFCHSRPNMFNGAFSRPGDTGKGSKATKLYVIFMAMWVVNLGQGF